MPRYRIEYSKTGGARWLSHLELIRTFIRALRRSGLPLAFSQGFNPHPKLSYGPSLGVGVAGLREYLDVDLATGVPLSEGLASLRQQFPPGLETRCLMELAPAASGIGKAVNCAWYRLALPPEQPADAWQQAIDRLIGGSHPLYYKRPKDGKLFDVRSALAACWLTEVGDKRSEAGTVECGASPGTWGERTSVLKEGDGLVLDLLVDLGNAAVPLRGIVETLLPLTEVAGCYEPARVTRIALLRHNGGLVNPLGERKQLWEA
jgi:radical SAM-linked protein